MCADRSRRVTADVGEWQRFVSTVEGNVLDAYTERKLFGESGEIVTLKIVNRKYFYIFAVFQSLLRFQG